MYTVTYPKNARLNPIYNVTLKDAIKEKLTLEVDRIGDVAVIIDEDGYIVSSRMINLYIIQNLV